MVGPAGVSAGRCALNASVVTSTQRTRRCCLVDPGVKNTPGVENTKCTHMRNAPFATRRMAHPEGGVRNVRCSGSHQLAAVHTSFWEHHKLVGHHHDFDDVVHVGVNVRLPVATPAPSAAENSKADFVWAHLN